MRLALCLFVALAPLPLGGREPWFLAGAAAFLALAWAAWLGAAAHGELRLRGHWMFLLPLALLGMALLQLVPGTAWSTLAPAAAERWRELGEALGTDLAPRAALAPAHTFDALAALLVAFAFALLAHQLFGDRRGLLQLALAVLAGALLNALLGYAALLELISPPYEALRGKTGAMAGTFWNRNHFGQLMAFGAIQAVGLALAVWFTHLARRDRATGLRRRLQTHWQGIALAAATLALALGGAALVSLSRGAFAAGLAGLALLLFLAWRRRQARARLALAALAFFLLAVGGGHAAISRVADRFDEILGIEELTLDGRIWIWRESLGILREHWLLGIGPEAFRSVSPRYEGAWKHGRISLHAHNDWLELPIEYGIPLAAAVLAGGILWLVLAMRRCWRQRDPFACWLGLGAGAALAAAALHSLVDYPLRSPGMLIVAAAAAVLLALAARLHHDHVPRLRLRLSVPLRLAAALLALLVAGHALARLPGDLAAGRARARLRAFAQPGAAPLPPSSLVPVKRTAEALADKVLDRWPSHPAARKIRGTARHDLALAGWDSLAEAQPEADPETIERNLAGAVEDLRQACLADPCDGRAHILLAQALEHLAILRAQPDEEHIRRLHELGAASTPAIAANLRAAGEGIWRSWQRTGDPATREQAVALLARTIRVEPRFTPEILAALRAAGIPPAELRDLLPDHVLAHQALHAELARLHLHEECLAQLDTLERINRQRGETAAKRPFTTVNEEHRLPPTEDVADAIVRHRLHALAMLGRWDERNRQLREHRRRGDQADRRRLERARHFLDSDQPLLALPLLERVAHQAPELAATHLLACRAFRRLDRADDALAALLPLIYRTTADFPAAILREAAIEADAIARLPSRQRPPYAKFLAPALGLRTALADGTPPPDSTAAEIERAHSALPGSTAWSQPHLVPHYLGLARAACGDHSEAARAFARVLAQCPANLPAARELLQLPESLPTEIEQARRQARELAERTDNLIPLAADLAPWLRLLGFRLEPLADSPAPGPVRLVVALLCTEQPSSTGGIIVAGFAHQGQPAFTTLRLPLAEEAGDTPAWRVGQTIFLETTFNPNLLAIRARRPLRPGPYTISLRLEAPRRHPRLQPYPPVEGLAFRVQPETLAPEYPR